VIEGKAVVSDRRRERIDWSRLRGLGRELAQEDWDLVIDLTGNRYSALLCHWVGARYTLGFDGAEIGGLYATRVADAERPGRHLSERPFRVLEPLLERFEHDGKVIPPEPVRTYEETCREMGLDSERPLAVAAPGAGWPEKEWGEARFGETCRLLAAADLDVALVDRPTESARLHRIASLAGQGQGNVRTVAEASLDTALSLLSKCAALVSNDSGLGHLAAAFGRPTLPIFTGASDPRLCCPLGPRVEVHDAREADLAPEFIAQRVRAYAGREGKGRRSNSDRPSEKR
jgi:ADP-heptose:LPS heptosyltransferase